MRISPLSHPLAVLRTTIGLTQKEMGDLVDRAARTIQAVELGKLPLSEDLAMLIAQATGIDAGWLVEGDPSIPPRKGITARNIGTATGPYIRDDYEFHRAWVESPVASLDEVREVIQNPTPKDGKPFSMSIPVVKGALLVHKKNMVAEYDLRLIAALKRLLDHTAVTKSSDLVRWRLRRAVAGLAEENGVTLDLPNLDDIQVAHVHTAKEKSVTPPKRAKKQPPTKKRK